ncbi:uncharacterized protein BcabD6B2_35140 [Babesia caballi]|uniref:Uncharacterized protein n=1 Tax=Babesia caballi TaxID=5871 RepID=A0AAV4LZX4_BABCB|nr:hypothetical protein, conserved [Babesia caballi]
MPVVLAVGRGVPKGDTVVLGVAEKACVVEELLRDAAHVDAGAAKLPLCAVCSGTNVVEQDSLRAEAGSFLGSGEAAAAAANYGKIIRFNVHGFRWSLHVRGASSACEGKGGNEIVTGSPCSWGGGTPRESRASQEVGARKQNARCGGGQ